MEDDWQPSLRSENKFKSMKSSVFNCVHKDIKGQKLPHITKTTRKADMDRPRHIYIVGAQSTGKTTLVQGLQVSFSRNTNIPQPQIIEEVARNILLTQNFVATDLATSPFRALELQQVILKAQFVAEQKALINGTWFISDRSAVDAIVYTRKFVSEDGVDHLLMSAEWRDCRERMEKATVVVCEPVMEWLVDDGVRLLPSNRAAWMEVHELFCKTLDDLNLKYILLPSILRNVNERVEFVLKRWELLNDASII